MHNYSKHYKNEKEAAEIKEPVVEEVVETKEPVVEEVVETKEPVVKEVVETKEPVEEEQTIIPVMGVVTECAMLNVREAPEPDAEVLVIIDFGEEVMIDESESTDDFYKVYTKAGIEGFCMKQFIAV